MMHRVAVLLAMTVIAVHPLRAQPGDTTTVDIASRRMHLMLYTGAHMTGNSYRIPAAPVTDLRNADEKCFGACVSYTVVQHVEIQVDAWSYHAVTGTDLTGQVNSGASGVGIGARHTFPEVAELFNPFIQSSVFYHKLTLTAPDHDWHHRGNNWGYGAGGGFDFRISRHVSVPLFFMYHQCRGDYDFSGFEINYGVGAHF